MDYCDTDKDGQINYQEFANFLNWKDKLPSGLPQSGESIYIVVTSFQLTDIYCCGPPWVPVQYSIVRDCGVNGTP